MNKNFSYNIPSKKEVTGYINWLKEQHGVFDLNIKVIETFGDNYPVMYTVTALVTEDKCKELYQLVFNGDFPY